GHTFMKFNNRNGSYDVMLHSYFQSEGDTIVTIDDILTENQIPAQLRLGPQAMPQGSFNIIPSAEFLRLKHVHTAATKAIASLTESDSQFVYSVEMPDLNRIITYTTSNQFPYTVMEWTDSYEDGGTMMETTATLKKTIQSAYWSKNSNADEYLRKELGL
ncbi:MAG: septum formation inhibitor Maf, partial [Nonlabens sp.]|nr:septum formation inhibitor Maf [Nonlabens sp.]